MIKRIFIVALSLLAISCSDSDKQTQETTQKPQETKQQAQQASTSSKPETQQSLKGYWVNKHGQAIAEITSSKAIITLLNEEEETYVFGYDKANDTMFELTGKGASNSTKMVANWEKNYFYITNFPEKGRKITFTPAPNLTDDEVNGTWYTHEEDDSGYESSVIVHQRDTSYDYDSLELYHDDKTYVKYLDLNVESIFTNGFMYKDPATDDMEEYVYYITSYSDDKNRLTFTDTTGYQWDQIRMPNAKHIAIPDGYTKEEPEE